MNALNWKSIGHNRAIAIHTFNPGEPITDYDLEAVHNYNMPDGLLRPCSIEFRVASSATVFVANFASVVIDGHGLEVLGRARYNTALRDKQLTVYDAGAALTIVFYSWYVYDDAALQTVKSVNGTLTLDYRKYTLDRTFRRIMIAGYLDFAVNNNNSFSLNRDIWFDLQPYLITPFPQTLLNFFLVGMTISLRSFVGALTQVDGVVSWETMTIPQVGISNVTALGPVLRPFNLNAPFAALWNNIILRSWQHSDNVSPANNLARFSVSLNKPWVRRFRQPLLLPVSDYHAMTGQSLFIRTLDSQNLGAPAAMAGLSVSFEIEALES